MLRRSLPRNALILALLLAIIFVANNKQLKNISAGQDASISSPNQSQLAKKTIFLPRIIIPVDLTKPLPPPISHSDKAPIDFAALRAIYISGGRDLAFNKIGFHVGPGGLRDGLGEWMRALDAAGVPFFLKSVDDAGPIFEAQELMKKSGVQHTLVYRTTTHGQDDGYDYDVPDYRLDPATAATVHWQNHLAKFPKELDPQYVWLETINEVNKDQSEWLGRFALETANLALRDGYRWAAFGWSSGEPEAWHWKSPSMLAFLRLAAQYPDRLAVALHEYSYTADTIGMGYPYLVGRFQALFQVCDENGIDRPTVLITEWGWEAENVPDPTEALRDISWAAWLYSAYPQVRGAAIWYLGPEFDNIANQAQKLISPVTDYSLNNYFEIFPGPGKIESNILAPWPTIGTNSPDSKTLPVDRRLH